MTPADRFWAKVEWRGPDGCWLWTGCVNASGYGRFHFGSRHQAVQAHRWIYERLVMPVPPGLVLDHLCRVRRCVNPAHLEPVTIAENVRRGVFPDRRQTHCHAGHPFDETNTYVAPSGHRACRTCVALRVARNGRAKRNPRKMVKAA